MAPHHPEPGVPGGLTVSPVLGLEPARSRGDAPTLGAVRQPLRWGERHGREHVGHVVALVAQLDLRARLWRGDRRT